MPWIVVTLVGAAVGLTPLAAHANPKDPFDSVPSRETTAPTSNPAAATPLDPGRDGALPYSFRVTLPPGRSGTAPDLALRYSSSGALRGGLAAGWSLDLPTITRDLSRDTEAVYNANLGGSSLRLVPTPQDVTASGGVAYRALNDDLTRFEAQDVGGDVISSWAARTIEGSSFVFAGAAGVASDFTSRWHVTQQTDSDGNRIDYTWALQTISPYVDWVPQTIEYGANTAANIGHFAKVDFVYAPIETCPGSTIPLGARVEHRGQTLNMFGSRRLTEMVISVRDTPGGAYREVRRVKLGYDAAALSCSGAASPLRYLAKIDETVTSPTGVVSQAPTTTFAYGATAPTWSATASVSAPDYAETGDQSGTLSRLQDMDGDGLVDYVKMQTWEKCTLEIHKGLYGGGFSAHADYMPLPTADWADPQGPSSLEWCRLEGQSAYRPAPTCLPNACWDSRANIAYNFVDWDGDGRVDVVAHAWGRDLGADFPAIYPTLLWNDNSQGPTAAQCGANATVSSSGGCSCNDDYAPGQSGCEPICWQITANGCEDSPYADITGPPGGITDHGSFAPPAPEPGEVTGTYRWRVFGNEGSAFYFWGSINRAPAPLPLGGGMTATDSLGYPILPLFVDINGDGLTDVVKTPNDPAKNELDLTKTVGFGTTLQVYLNTGSLEGPGSGLAPEVDWSLPLYPQASATAEEYTVPGIDWPAAYPDHVNAYTPLSLADVDGDGLPDLIANNSAGQLGVVWNRGGAFATGFTPFPRSGPGWAAPSLDIPYLEKTADIVGVGYQFEQGVRGSVVTPMDVDLDGLSDQLVIGAKYGDVRINPAGVRKGYLNLGAGPSLVTSQAAAWDAARSLIVAQNGTWHLTTEVLDLNGDGVPDLATWSKVNGGAQGLLPDSNVVGGYIATLATEPAGATPLRLLSSIQNGRGAVTTITYAPTTNPAVVNRGDKPLAQVRWVLRTITESPGAGQPSLTRTFSYANPVIAGTDPLDRVDRLVGFGTLTIESGSLLKTVSHGVLLGDTIVPSEEETWVAPAAGQPLTLSRDVVHTHAVVPLVGDKSFFHYESETADHACSAGQTPQDCTALTTNAKHTTHVWQGTQLVDGTIAFPLHTQTTEWIGSAAARVTTRGYVALDAGDDYHVELASEETGPVGGAYFARTIHEDFDADLRPKKTRVAVNQGVDVTTAVTYDAAGNVVTVKRPTQYATTGLVSTTTYDAFKMYPVQKVNELGHTVLTQNDLGTGALVRREGPDFRMVPPASCATPPCAQVKSYSPEVFVIDGFGRVLQRSIAGDPPAGTPGYALFLADTRFYDDVSVPNHRTLTTKLGFIGAAVRITDETLDGRGRVASSTASGGAGTTPVSTTYHYDAQGGLAAIDQPDPQNDAAIVTSSFVRDGLGRVTTFTRPDGSQSKSTYGALDTLLEEVAPDGTLGERTKYVRDPAGRLTSVIEYDNPTVGASATTTYTYDLSDRVSRIVDPDGTITDATYDLVGHRRSVTRGTRRWTFAYDRDGNLIQRRMPLPAVDSDPTLYTSINTYDALDRLVLHTPAPKTLTATERAALAIVPTQYTYDTSAEGIGKLAQVSWSYGTKTHTYDVQHRPRVEAWSINLPATPTFAMQRSVTRTFTPSGQMATEAWDDGSQWAIQYDFLDRASKVQWLDASMAAPAWKDVAVYTRSLAGPPRTRTGNYGPPRAWQYDSLGRITGDTIGTGAVVKSARSFTYDGFGNLTAVTGQTNGTVATASYAYDKRHRIAQTAGPGTYNGAFTYSAGGNVKRATVTGATDTPARDAKYLYGAVDKQAVDSLTDFTSGAAIASFGYDMSGNVISRTTGAGVEQLLWDGDDVLRQISGPAGTERYVYDHEGQRMLSIRSTGVTLWTDNTETRYSPAGAALTRWMTLAAGETVARVENKTSIEVQYTDALGSTLLAVNPAGTTTGSFLYGAFGEVAASTGDDTHPVQFQGKQTDEISGFHYHDARYYDPLTLRWISADPLYRAIPDFARAEPQRGNWYTFNLDNPVHYADPDGRNPWEHVKALVREQREQRERDKAVTHAMIVEMVKKNAAAPDVSQLWKESKTLRDKADQMRDHEHDEIYRRRSSGQSTSEIRAGVAEEDRAISELDRAADTMSKVSQDAERVIREDTMLLEDLAKDPDYTFNEPVPGLNIATERLEKSRQKLKKEMKEKAADSKKKEKAE